MSVPNTRSAISRLIFLVFFFVSVNTMPAPNVVHVDMSGDEQKNYYTQFNFPLSKSNHHNKPVKFAQSKITELAEGVSVAFELESTTVKVNQPNIINVYTYLDNQRTHKDNVLEHVANIEGKNLPAKYFNIPEDFYDRDVRRLIKKISVIVAKHPLDDYLQLVESSSSFPDKSTVQMTLMNDGRYVGAIHPAEQAHYVIYVKVSGQTTSGEQFYQEFKQPFRALDVPLTLTRQVSTEFEATHDAYPSLYVNFDVAVEHRVSGAKQNRAYLSGQLWGTDKATGQVSPIVQFSGLTDVHEEAGQYWLQQSIATEWLAKSQLVAPFVLRDVQLILPDFYYLKSSHIDELALHIEPSKVEVLQVKGYDGIETENMLLGKNSAVSTTEYDGEYNLFYVPDLCANLYGDGEAEFYDEQTVFMDISSLSKHSRLTMSMSSYANMIDNFLRKHAERTDKGKQYAAAIAHGIGGLAAFEAMIHYRHSPLLYSASSYKQYALQTIGTPWRGSQMVDIQYSMSFKDQLEEAKKLLQKAFSAVAKDKKTAAIKTSYEMTEDKIEDSKTGMLTNCVNSPYLKPDVVQRWHAMLNRSYMAYQSALAKMATHGTYGITGFLYDGCSPQQSVLLSNTHYAHRALADLDDMFSLTFDTVFAKAKYNRVWKGSCYQDYTLEMPDSRYKAFKKQTKHSDINEWLFRHAARTPKEVN